MLKNRFHSSQVKSESSHTEHGAPQRLLPGGRGGRQTRLRAGQTAGAPCAGVGQGERVLDGGGERGEQPAAAAFRWPVPPALLASPPCSSHRCGTVASNYALTHRSPRPSSRPPPPWPRAAPTRSLPRCVTPTPSTGAAPPPRFASWWPVRWRWPWREAEAAVAVLKKMGLRLRRRLEQPPPPPPPTETLPPRSTETRGPTSTPCPTRRPRRRWAGRRVRAALRRGAASTRHSSPPTRPARRRHRHHTRL